MDRYYTYYNCIRMYAYDPTYTCVAYGDPLRIPRQPDACENIIIPVHKWVPVWYHSRYITQTLKDRISVSIN
jgi:hypothetical protein